MILPPALRAQLVESLARLVLVALDRESVPAGDTDPKPAADVPRPSPARRRRPRAPLERTSS